MLHFIDGGFLIISLTLLAAGGLLYAWYCSEHVSESLQPPEDLSDILYRIDPTVTPFLKSNPWAWSTGPVEPPTEFQMHCTHEGARVYTAEEINEFAGRWNVQCPNTGRRPCYCKDCYSVEKK